MRSRASAQPRRIPDPSSRSEANPGVTSWRDENDAHARTMGAKGIADMPAQTITLHVPAIHCEGCLNTVRKALEAAGAEFESGDAESKRLTVRFAADRLSAAHLATVLEKVGFPPAEAPAP